MKSKKGEIISIEEVLIALSDSLRMVQETNHDDRWLDKKVLKAESIKDTAGALIKITSLQLQAADMGGENSITLLEIPAGQIKKKQKQSLLN